MSKVQLQDRFEARTGQILINGVNALVRLMLVQADVDAAAGRKTGGFVSGYRGSPLGGLDMAFASAKELTDARGIVVKPAVNEELAATAIAGTQQIDQTPGAKVEGVFSLWYGKGPGFDRASDAIRHGVQQGTSATGGVVLAVGDDHVAKSSSIVCSSDEMVAGVQVPLFYPADPEEVVRFGLHAFAMSRHTGSWTALKIITEVADGTRTVSGNHLPFDPVLPPLDQPVTGLHNRWPEMPLEQEARHVAYQLPAIAAYVRANRLDRIVLKSPGARIGLVAAGKSWLDLSEALALLGLDEGRLAALGIALYKPALIWPLEGEGLAEFAEGLDHLLVIEEKGAFIEDQAKAVLYGIDAAPKIWGKRGPGGKEMLPPTGDLTPERIAAVLGAQIGKLTDDAQVAEQTEHMQGLVAVQNEFAIPPQLRRPFFCSGCPHNRSTVLPEGSRALAGIGCHGLAAYNQPRTSTVSQMGGEGVHWMGLSPFTEEEHIFANLGDGTYFHSGLLAVRQSVAAKLNITYKLLYNAAVAMTGGQPVDGELTIPMIVDQLRAEGVARVVICADDLDRYPSGDPVCSRVEKIVHRDEMDALQRELREVEGVTVIVYDQMCATEKRRLRKRGRLADPDKRVFINDLVCEGCGDCSVKSNCLSVEPVATPLGVKRRINQSSCNKDYSCIEGFCPSFVTVEGGTPRKAQGGAAGFDPATLPSPPRDAARFQRIIVAGVGGTGVVTIGALIAMATHIGGGHVGVLDQTGMAQKGGAVVSHIQIGDRAANALRIPADQADLIIACDQIVANQKDVISAIDPGRTHVLANADISITGDFTQNRDAAPSTRLLEERLRKRAGAEQVDNQPFSQLAESLFGNAIASNLMMVGYCWQKGWLDIDVAALDQAIELNGAAVSMNKAAFAWGRRLAVDPRAVHEAGGLIAPPEETAKEMVDRRVAFLTDYQNAAYGERFATKIAQVRQAEGGIGGDGSLARTVARALFQLMAYKDEYEVARLFTDGSFRNSLNDTFEGNLKLSYYMAAPIISRKGIAGGPPRKRRLGGWLTPLLRVMAKGKVLRGTRADLFGYSAERREERAMIFDYEALIDTVVSSLRRHNHAEAVKVLGLVLEVRGYGHVKQEAAARYRDALPAALEAFQAKREEIPAQVSAG